MAAAYLDPVSGDTVSIDSPIWRSPAGRPLMLTSVPGIGPEAIETETRSLWRYRAALPLAVPEPVSLGEGCTPLVRSRFDGVDTRFKLEWFSPTGSFKDRGASVMLSILRQQGIRAVVEDSSGNGGAAIAAYGAAAGMETTIMVPAATSPSKIAQIRAYGARVELVPGPREATEAAALERAESVFYASHNWHPFFLQGTKTLGYEIWEDLGFAVPDAVVVPVGAGSNLLGCWIAFRELLDAGVTDRMPRLYLTQPQHCAPVHAAFQAGADDFVETGFAPTIAEGTAIKRPIRLAQLLAALRETGGGTAALTEDDILDASLSLARSGLYVEPTCAHAAAGLKRFVAAGEIDPDETTVVVLTGSGLKATGFYAAHFEKG